MSDTLLKHAPSQSLYNPWKVAVYEVLDEKLDQREDRSYPPEPVRAEPLPKVKLDGHKAPDTRIGKFLATNLFGDRADRKENARYKGAFEKNVKEIEEMRKQGAAAQVFITGEGKRTLQGNFFSAKDYNLKENDNKVDTSRPVVLLLTGSGGSAEYQGLDIAKFYADEGASVLSVNYAGFGDSDEPEGTPSELSMKQDAQSMLQYLVNLGYNADKIIIHGYSLGAAVAAELQEANEKAGTKFRGAVQDRPMLSTMHGVESRKGKLFHWAGALARDKVGAFQGERAIKRMDGTTPMVITSDKGAFAERADALRAELQKDRSNVAGAQSDAEHEAHGAMLWKNRGANADALRQLIAKDRDGNSDLPPVRTYPTPGEMAYEELVKACKDNIFWVRNGVNELSKKLAALCNDDNSIDPQDLLDDARLLTANLVDMMNYAPKECPDLASYQVLVENAIDTLLQATFDLRDRLNHGTTNITPTHEEIDFFAILADDKLGRLKKAGGPAKQNRDLEDEVLRMSELQRKLGIKDDMREDMHGDLQQIFDELYATSVQIRNRRAV